MLKRGEYVLDFLGIVFFSMFLEIALQILIKPKKTLYKTANMNNAVRKDAKVKLAPDCFFITINAIRKTRKSDEKCIVNFKKVFIFLTLKINSAALNTVAKANIRKNLPNPRFISSIEKALAQR